MSELLGSCILLEVTFLVFKQSLEVYLFLHIIFLHVEEKKFYCKKLGGLTLWYNQKFVDFWNLSV